MRPDLRRAAPLLIVVLAVFLAGGAASPAPAHAQSCDDIPSIPGVPNPIQTGCDVVTSVPDIVADPGGAVTDVVTAPLDAAGDQVMQGVTRWVANGASWLVGQAGKLIDDTTTPRLDSPWFERQYTAMAGLAAVLALPLLLLSIIQGVLKRDGQVVVRAAFVQLPAAFVLTAGAVAVVVLFLQLTDEMCGAVSGSVGGDADEFFKDTGDAISKLAVGPGQGGAPLFAVFLGGLIAAVGAFFVWVELVIRSAAVYVTVLFLPFTFVAMIWPTTARWCRRLVELLFAVIFSKFVIVAIMSLAAAGLGQSRAEDAFQGVLAGAALMVLAAMSPLVLLRLIPLAETAAHTNWRSGAGSQALGPIAGPAAVMRRVSDGNWGGMGGGGLRAAPAAAGAGAGPAGLAAAGGAAAAGAMAGGVRTRGEGVGATRGVGGSGPDEGRRYAAVGSGGQATRPAATTNGNAGTDASAGPQQDQAPSGGRDPGRGSSSARGQGGPRPMAPPRDLRGPGSDEQGGGNGR